MLLDCEKEQLQRELGVDAFCNSCDNIYGIEKLIKVIKRSYYLLVGPFVHFYEDTTQDSSEKG